ncbi:FkbM family methyltransferase [Treponema sp. C6A8]|uniref:FkbM family methyltransferase n=1 Tax=Treponema sp. C6A8 TaxID=1410609 RepID=UPI0004820D99|nr:FkbM family methyltransferase [Treponema sp. C6A8]
MKNCILYGAGSDLEKILPLLRKNDYNPLCIIDGNPQKVGKIIYDIPVVSSEKIFDYNSKIIIITASFFDSIHENLVKILDSNINEYSILVSPYAWLMLVNVEYNSDLLKRAAEFIEDNKESIVKLYDCSDRKTDDILNFLIGARTEKFYKFYEYNLIQGMQYVEGYFYENELKDIGSFTFVDVGAYIGDTYKAMISMYNNMINYYAYEPSEKNFKLLKKFSSERNNDNCVLECRNYALGDMNGQISFGKQGAEFGIINDSNSSFCEKINVKRLDDDNINVIGKLVIKMDVEGSEMEVLGGGLETIKKYNPIMAICVYHRYQDIYDIPKFLIDNGLKYRFILKSGIHTHLLAIPIK